MRRSFQLSPAYKRLLVHLLLGVLATMVSVVSSIVFMLAFLYYMNASFSKKANWLIIAEAIIYLTSWEILLRMNYVFLPWETGKLTTLFFLLLGLIRFGSGKKVIPFIMIFVLLLPAIFLQDWTDTTQARENITFQLGGMLVLAMSGIFLRGRRVHLVNLSDLLKTGIYPAIAVLVSITLKSPSLAELEFDLGANFASSGGYGPNQVSTFLGFGLLMLVVHNLLSGPVWKRNVDFFIMAIFLLRILLTFSRGGLIGAVIPILLAYIWISYTQGKVKYILQTTLALLPLLLGSFYAVNQITDGLLVQRFKGETYATNAGFEEVTLTSASSGRTEILRTDWEMFLDYPVLGVGLGESNRLRSNYGYHNISHIEQTRLLAEHGLFGTLVLLIMIGLMLWTVFKARQLGKLPVLVFALFSFLTMFHSATRLALPSFLFGLGFLILVNAKNSLHRKPA